MRLCTASTVVTAETSLAIYMLGRSFPPSLIAETATRLLTTALSTVGPSVVSRYAMIAFSVSVLIFLRRRVKNSAGDKDAAVSRRSPRVTILLFFTVVAAANISAAKRMGPATALNARSHLHSVPEMDGQI